MLPKLSRWRTRDGSDTMYSVEACTWRDIDMGRVWCGGLSEQSRRRPTATNVGERWCTTKFLTPHSKPYRHTLHSAQVPTVGPTTP